MAQAEIDAIAATNAKGLKGTPNDVMMNKLSHELQGERISNAVKMEDRLRQLIIKVNESREHPNPMVYKAVRKKALDIRQDLITQREAAGMNKDAAALVEAMFPIP